jgi:NDP-sugar pyrophosphorylase family protein
MVDVYLELAKHESILGYDHTGSRLLDVGKPESIIEAEKYFL